jgi:hypothetical protein
MFNFRRLKINYESHEFILDSGTVANTYAYPTKITLTHLQNLKASFCILIMSSKCGGGYYLLYTVNVYCVALCTLFHAENGLYIKNVFI